MEQRVRIDFFSNFTLAILVGFLILILTATPASNKAKPTPVMTLYITLLFSSPFSPKMWKHDFVSEISVMNPCISLLGWENILDGEV